MPFYPVLCYRRGCGQEAQFKIAALWSDGLTTELKTYFLCCPDCLKTLYPQALERHKRCRLSQGESLEMPGIYQLQRGARDRTLLRRWDLEEAIRPSA